MIKREINIFLDNVYKDNKELGGMRFKQDNRGKNNVLFFQDYKNFQIKFDELIKLQNERETLSESGNIFNTELRQKKNKIKFGIKKLKDYHQNMKRIKNIIKPKNLKKNEIKNKDLIEESLEKTQQLLNLLEKKERIYIKKYNNKRKINNNRLEKNSFLITTDNFSKEKNLNKNFLSKNTDENNNYEKEEKLTKKDNNLLKNWKTQMNRLDEDLEDLYNNLLGVNTRLNNIEENMDENERIVNSMKPGLENLGSELKNVNKSLKRSLRKMRSPNKLCMDIFLLFILALLIGVLIWIFKFYWSLNYYD